MFSHNGKISERQLRCMLLLSVFAGGIFVLPYLSARLFGSAVLPGLLLFLVLAAGYTAVLFLLTEVRGRRCGNWEKRMKEGAGAEICFPAGGSDAEGDISGNGRQFLAAECSENRKVSAGMGFLSWVRVIRLFFRLSFYIVLCIAILQEAQVPFLRGRGENSLWNAVMVVPLLLVALYAAVPSFAMWGGKKRGLGIEKQARICELIFPVLFVPFVVMLLFGLGEVDFDIFRPQGGGSFGRLLFCAYALLTFLLPVENVYYLRPFLRMADRDGQLRKKQTDQPGQLGNTQADTGGQLRKAQTDQGGQLGNTQADTGGQLRKAQKDRECNTDGTAEEDQNVGEGEMPASDGGDSHGLWQSTGFSRNNRKRYYMVTGILLLMVVLTLLIQGIYGVHGAGQEEMLTISIMRYIRLPFGVLERFDVLMVWFFMTGCFVLVMSTLYQMGTILHGLYPSVRCGLLSASALLAAWLFAVCLPSYRQTLAGFLGYGVFVDIPLSLLLPLLEQQTGKRRKKKGIRHVACLFLLIGTAAFLTGCQMEPSVRNDMRNVEERDYATLLVASRGTDGHAWHFDLGTAQERRVGEKSHIETVSGWDCDDLRTLAREYQKIKGKDLSLSHLKVILWEGQDTVLNKDLMEFLVLLDENEEVAKTCPLLQIGDREELLRYLREAEAPVGSYVEQVIRSGERQEKNIPWLSDYLKAMREGQGVEAYVLESVPEGFLVKRYTYLFER